MPVPDSIRKKMYRAHQNFEELTAEVGRYFKSNPGKLVPQQESTPDTIIAAFQTKDSLPSRMPLIAGDCLQNLRSSLDYLVWELVLAEGKEPGKHNSFPICSGPTADVFEDAIKWHGKRPGCLEGIPLNAVAEIRNLQPCRLGDDWQKDFLWVLNELTNLNKHRRIILADLSATDAPPDLKIVDINGERWFFGSFPPVDANTKLAPFPVTPDPNMHRQIFARITFNEAVAKGHDMSAFFMRLFNYLGWDFYLLRHSLAPF